MSVNPQRDLFEASPTMPPTPPVQIQWVSDASGVVRCELVASCGCEGVIKVKPRTGLTAEQYAAAIEQAIAHTVYAAMELLLEHDEDDPAEGLAALEWLCTHTDMLRTGWQTAMPFTQEG